MKAICLEHIDFKTVIEYADVYSKHCGVRLEPTSIRHALNLIDEIFLCRVALNMAYRDKRNIEHKYTNLSAVLTDMEIDVRNWLEEII